MELCTLGQAGHLLLQPPGHPLLHVRPPAPHSHLLHPRCHLPVLWCCHHHHPEHLQKELSITRLLLPACHSKDLQF